MNEQLSLFPVLQSGQPIWVKRGHEWCKGAVLDVLDPNRVLVVLYLGWFSKSRMDLRQNEVFPRTVHVTTYEEDD